MTPDSPVVAVCLSFDYTESKGIHWSREGGEVLTVKWVRNSHAMFQIWTKSVSRQDTCY